MSLAGLSGRLAQSVARLTQEPEVPGMMPVWPFTFVSPSTDQEEQLSIAGEGMCTKYCSVAKGVSSGRLEIEWLDKLAVPT